jgi:hypothetical protein
LQAAYFKTIVRKFVEYLNFACAVAAAAEKNGWMEWRRRAPRAPGAGGGRRRGKAGKEGG